MTGEHCFSRRKKGSGVVGNVLKSIVPSLVSSVPSLVNRAVDVLPLELHLPGYRFCGPGTKLEERLARGERGINVLDEACREHDIAYAKYKDNERRRIADRVLASRAWERVKASDSGISERAYAAAVAAVMKAKSALGSGRGGGGTKKKKKTTKTKATRRRKTGTRVRKTSGRVTRKRVGKRKTASGLYLRPYRKN